MTNSDLASQLTPEDRGEPGSGMTRVPGNGSCCLLRVSCVCLLLCLSAEMAKDWQETSTECLTADERTRIARACFGHVSCAAILLLPFCRTITVLLSAAKLFI